MRLFTLLLALVALRTAAVTLYLAGDSTMADFGNTTETDKQGWGVFLKYSLTGITVVDKGTSGRSARSYTREGRFTEIYKALSSGDYVVIEFGHNDDKTDGGRWCCSGSGSELCYEYYGGVNETVYTFPVYLKNATALFQSKGATVLISSMTPRVSSSAFKSGSFVYSPDKYVSLAKLSAEQLGVAYADHGYYTAAYYSNITHSQVTALFATNDTTHTNPKGAALVAKTFVRALDCTDSTLSSYIKNTTILGTCLPKNSTSSSIVSPVLSSDSPQGTSSSVATGTKILSDSYQVLPSSSSPLTASLLSPPSSSSSPSSDSFQALSVVASSLDGGKISEDASNLNAGAAIGEHCANLVLTIALIFISLL